MFEVKFSNESIHLPLSNAGQATRTKPDVIVSKGAITHRHSPPRGRWGALGAGHRGWLTNQRCRLCETDSWQSQPKQSVCGAVGSSSQLYCVCVCVASPDLIFENAF